MDYHKHDECEHKNIKFCPKCKIPYCPDCGKEWAEPCTLPHYQWYPYYYPTTTNPWITWGSDGTGDPIPGVTITYCNHS